MQAVLPLPGGVETDSHHQAHVFAALAFGQHGDFARAGSQTLQRVHLATTQAEGTGILTVLELERQDAHADQIRAFYTLVARRHHRPHAEKQGSVGRPVA